MSLLPSLFAGFHLDRPLVHNATTSLYLATQLSNGRQVLMRLPQLARGLAVGHAALDHESSLIRPEADGPYLLPQSVVHEGSRSALVYEDPGLRPLELPDRAGATSPRQALRIGLAVVRAVEQLHDRGLFHLHLEPGSILVDPRGDRAVLTNFYASIRKGETAGALPESAGNASLLTWMSPEQSGRLGLPIDGRSDLYALGVILFALLSGRLPLRADGDRQWTHRLLAVRPPALATVCPELPTVIGQLVDRLLEKDPNHRYQNATGLRQDLERCLDEWELTGTVRPFPLSDRTNDALRLRSSALFGREAERDALQQAIREVRDGGSALVLASGAAGIGKTFLLDSVLREYPRDALRVLRGKSDQYRAQAPYYSLIQSLSVLARQLLALPQPERARWRRELDQAVGNSGQVLIDLEPSLALLLGPQPPIEPLPPERALIRLHLVFREFLQVCARAERPLVLFLDDLQWVDAPTLQVVEDLLTGGHTRHLLVLGAWRDADLDIESPVRPAVGRLLDTLANSRLLHLDPLDTSGVSAIVAEALSTTPAEVAPLTQAVARKTRGNPYFVREFLSAAGVAGHLHVDPGSAAWQWDLSGIEAMPSTDNVIDFLTARIGRLPEAARRSLQLAACMGPEFEDDVLAAAAAQPASTLTEHLQIAVDAGLLDESFQSSLVAAANQQNPTQRIFRFTHDRVQEAAVSSVAPAELPTLHLRIGRALLGSERGGDAEFRIQRVAPHFERAAGAIEDADERLWLADLELAASRRALRSAAVDAAHAAAEVGLSLLPDDAWDRFYRLTLDLHVVAADAAYVRGQVERADALVALVLGNARDVVDKVQVYRVRFNLLVNQIRFRDALNEALELLDLLGVECDPTSGPAGVGAAFVAVQEALGGRGPDALDDLPPVADPVIGAALQTLCEMIPAATMSWPELASLATFRGMELLLRHGVGPQAPPICGSFALHLCVMGNVEAGHGFGELGMRLFRRYPTDPTAVMILVQFPVFVQHMREPLRDTIALLAEGAATSLETANLVAYGYCVNQGFSHSLFASLPLGALDERADPLRQRLLDFRQDLAANSLAIFGQIVAKLRHDSETPWRLTGERFDWQQQTPNMIARANHMGRFFAHVGQLWLCVLHRRWDRALDDARAAREIAMAAPSMYCRSMLDFYGSLAVIVAMERLPEQQAALRDELAGFRDNLVRWADYAPANHAHKVALVDAEVARLEGREQAAVGHYDRAAHLALSEGFTCDAGLAAELAARFHAERGHHTHARGLLLTARDAYAAWGAHSKVHDVEARLTRSALGPVTSSPPTNEGNPLDVETLIAAAEVISGDRRLDELVGRFLEYTIANAGATRGCLFLDEDDGLHLAAQGLSDGGIDRTAAGRHLDDCDDLARGVIRYVQQAQVEVVLDEEAGAEVFGDDSWLAAAPQPLSVLCVPLSSRGQLVGALYLENDLVRGAFTAPRVELLRVVSSVAATAVENARLYLRLATTTEALQESHTRLQSHSQDLESAVEQRTAELAELHRDHELILSSMFDGICRLDERGDIVYVNPATETMTGRSQADLVGRSHHVLLADPPQGRDRWCPLCGEGGALKLGELLPTRSSFLRHGAAPFTVEVASRPIRARDGSARGVVVTFRDVSHRDRLEQQLQHAQRMESLGQFVGGVAHEFNNLLMPIIGGVGYLRQTSGAGPDAPSVIANMERAGQRASDLVGQFLAFGRRSEIFMRPTNLETVVDDVEGFLVQALDRSIAVSTRRSDGPVWTVGDAGQLHQVLLNLCLNARDALSGPTAPETGRRIDIRTDAVAVSSEAIPEGTVAEAGRYVRIEVIDNGPGMDQAHLDVIFEPFFTTKAVGEGSGLGLAVVYGIVRNHRGWVSCQSTPTSGTRFQVFLPAHEPTDDDLSPGDSPVRVERAENAFRIMVVDDEDMVLEIISTMLEHLGHDVVAVLDGQTALDTYREGGADIDLVLVDLSMPTMSGEQLIRELQAIDPAVRIVICSGYAGGREVTSAANLGALDFLRKPYTLLSLSETVNKAMGNE